jgi:predicted Zn-dependent peptidase
MNYSTIQNKSSYSKTILPNGLRVISEQIQGMQSFALGISVSAGSRNDYPELEGISHFMEHALFRRSQNHTGRQIVTAFEQIGAYVNAYTTKDHTCYYVRALNNHLEECFSLLTEIVLQPNIIETDVKKERGIIIEEIKSYEDEPEEMIFDIGEELLFKGSSLAHPISGYIDSVKKINADKLLNFHNDFYNPKNLIISFAGCHPHDDLVRLSEQLQLNPESFRSTEIFIPSALKPEKLIQKKPYQQSHLLITRHVEGIASADRYPIAVINSILGDGMSSRLNQLLREKLGYVYTVYSTISLIKECGTMSIYAASENNKIDKIRDIILKEIEKIFISNLTKKEIDRAKEQIKSNSIMALEGMSARIQSLIKSEISFGRYESIEDTIKEIDSVSGVDVYNCAKKYLVPDEWSEVRLIAK